MTAKLRRLEGRVKWWTDGAAAPQEAEFRRAGSGGWICEGHPYNFSQRVLGPVQTNQIAELLAVVIAIWWSWTPTAIITDSDW
eukprot:12747556-Heterocapsa_arctica.AAC.1